MGRVGNVSSDLHRAKAGSGLRAARVSKKDAGDKPKRSLVGSKKALEPLVISGTKGEPDYEEFDSVWDALGFSKEEAANLEMRSVLMMRLREAIRQGKWTQAVAAKRCGVSQPRINDLLRGRIDKFSIDALVNMIACLGFKVHLGFKAA